MCHVVSGIDTRVLKRRQVRSTYSLYIQLNLDRLIHKGILPIHLVDEGIYQHKSKVWKCLIHD